MKHRDSCLALLLPAVLLLQFGGAPAAQARLLGDANDALPAFEEDGHGAATADVDGDGDLDLVVGQDGVERLLLNRSGGVFVDVPGGVPDGGDRTVDVELVDVDGDGDPDLLAGTYDGQNRLYRNDGGVLVDASGGLPADADRSVDLAVGDLDGDGDVDVLVGNSSSQQNRLYLNQGGGTFADATGQLPVDADRTVELVVADLDGDGDLDALAANDLANRKYENLGGGLFADASGDLPPETDESYGIDVGDVDGDGDLDVLVGNRHGPDRLHRNDGFGVFVDDPAALPATTSSTEVVRLFDVDGDADLDAVLGNSGEDELLRNDGTGTFTDASDDLPDAASSTRDLAVGDFDGDGDPDLLATTIGERPDVLCRNDGGVFVDVSNGDRLAATASLDTLVDLDGDGALDAGGWQQIEAPGVAGLFLNDGSGRFTWAPELLPPGQYEELAGDDLDGDGDVDLLFGRDETRQARLFLGDGSGVFADASDRLPVDDDDLGPVALGDLDGDGDLDAYMGNSPGQQDPGQDHAYLNNGAATFTDGGGVPSEDDDLRDLELVDVDRDGDLDALLAQGPDGKRLWRNAGNATFSDASASLPNPACGSSTLAVGDVDADGDPDAYFGGAFSCFDELYLNDGTGSFVDVASTHLPGLILSNGVALGDLDGDRDLDLLVRSISFDLPDGSDRMRAFANDGTGVFSFLEDAFEAYNEQFPTGLLADLDGDGDLDAPLRGQVLFGWRRQATAVGAAVLGRELLFDLRGPAGGAWVLAYSPGRARIPVGGYGTLWVDPAGLTALGQGALDPDGASELTLPLPDDPALADLPVYVQGAVGMPFRLTNLEVVTLRAALP